MIKAARRHIMRVSRKLYDKYLPVQLSLTGKRAAINKAAFNVITNALETVYWMPAFIEKEESAA